MILKILLAITLLLLNPSYSSALTQWCEDGNIIGCYPYDGVNEAAGLLDVSTNDNDGTNDNSTFTTTNCQIDDCFNYDSTDKITYGDIGAIDAATLFSVVVWVYHDTTNTDDRMVYKLGSNEGFGLFRDNVSAKSSRADVYSIFVADGSQNTRLESNAGTTPLATLTHVAFSFEVDSGTGLRLYVNGTEVPDSPVSTVAIDDIHAGTVELSTSHDTSPFDGTIDEVALFDRILDSTDINDIMDNGLVQAGAAARRRIWIQ